MRSSVRLYVCTSISLYRSDGPPPLDPVSGLLRFLQITGSLITFRTHNYKNAYFCNYFVKHPIQQQISPCNINNLITPIIREAFKLNFAKIEAYKKSPIPTCQRLMNFHYSQRPNKLGQEPKGGTSQQDLRVRQRGLLTSDVPVSTMYGSSLSFNKSNLLID